MADSPLSLKELEKWHDDPIKFSGTGASVSPSWQHRSWILSGECLRLRKENEALRRASQVRRTET